MISIKLKRYEKRLLASALLDQIEPARTAEYRIELAELGARLGVSEQIHAYIQDRDRIREERWIAERGAK